MSATRLDRRIHTLTPAWWVIGVIVLLIIGGARLWYVNRYAAALPFWDQWDAEGDYLLRPWIEGTFPFHDFWRAHNEHRILPSRVMSLLIYEVTGQWNNLYAARINALWPALLGAAATLLVAARREAGGWRWVVVGVAVCCFVLPFSWENFLAGFQSQFYFLLMFSVAAFALASWRPADLGVMGMVLALCILCVLTMAGGLITPVAVGLVYAFDRYRRGDRSLAGLAMLLALGVIALIAFGTVPKVAGHAPLKAADAAQFGDALLHVFGWPVNGYHWPLVFLWLLPGLVVVKLAHSRSLTRTDMVFAACLAWSIGQGVVLAYGRGHDLLLLASRYSELLTPGLIACSWFSVRLLKCARSTADILCIATVALAFHATFAAGHLERFDGDMAAVRGRHQQSMEQTQNVARYLQTGSAAALDKTGLALPYPDKGRLRQLLDDPSIRQVLPVSLSRRSDLSSQIDHADNASQGVNR